MGFRDLESFNLALHAKQLWRLHAHPFTLLDKTLKAKYYPKNSVCDSYFGHNPSFAWRSILEDWEWFIHKDLERCMVGR